MSTPYMQPRPRIRRVLSYGEAFGEPAPQGNDPQALMQMLQEMQQAEANNAARFAPRGRAPSADIKPGADFIEQLKTQHAAPTNIAPYAQQMALTEAMREDADIFRGLKAQAESIFSQAASALPGISVSGGKVTVPKGSKGSTKLPAGSSIGAKIVAAAKKYLGTPYSWGGGGSKGPSRGQPTGSYPKQAVSTVGFDCSGLVQYAYARVGIKMPRVSYGQLKMGKRTAIKNLRPGDLVGNPAGSHIAIYIGGGKIIEAPRTFLNVRIRKLSASEMKSWYGVKVVK